jgi:hypothetical protein
LTAQIARLYSKSSEVRMEKIFFHNSRSRSFVI